MNNFKNLISCAGLLGHFGVLIIQNPTGKGSKNFLKIAYYRYYIFKITSQVKENNSEVIYNNV